MNEKAFTFFEKMAHSDKLSPNSVRLVKSNDFSDMDTAFIRKYAKPNSKVLDLGAGTGLIINKLFPYVESIVAVEPFLEFTKYIIKNKKITIVNADIDKFSTNKLFDIISFFGVMHYVDEIEAKAIYSKYIHYVSEEGKMIIKNQFGLYEDVTIDGFSEELQENYFSQYRHIDKELRLLREVGFNNIEVVDIYPKECNRWNNTHFYALVAGK